ALESELAAEQRDAAAGDHAFFDGRAGRVQCVLDAGLLLLHLGLGRSADLDDRDAADELREALLQLLAIVVARRRLDLLADLFDAALDGRLVARAVDDRAVVLVERDTLRATEVADRHVLELEAELFRDDLTAGQDGDVLQHLLAAITEARRLRRGAVERATKLVDDERRERLALDVLGDDEQRLLAARDRLEHGEEILHVGDLLLADEDVRVLEHDLHALGVRDEVRREVAAVELHALDDFERRLGGLALLDRDDAFLADLLH